MGGPIFKQALHTATGHLGALLASSSSSASKPPDTYTSTSKLTQVRGYGGSASQLLLFTQDKATHCSASTVLHRLDAIISQILIPGLHVNLNPLFTASDSCAHVPLLCTRSSIKRNSSSNSNNNCRSPLPRKPVPPSARAVLVPQL
jgi:hypothetical protein